MYFSVVSGGIRHSHFRQGAQSVPPRRDNYKYRILEVLRLTANPIGTYPCFPLTHYAELALEGMRR